MEKESLDVVTGYLHGLLHMPMTVFRKDQKGPEDMPVIDFLPEGRNPLFQRNLAERYMIYREDRMVSYYVSDDDVAFGCVNDLDGGYCVYVGPCLLSDLTDQLVEAMITRENSPFHEDPGKYREHIYSYLRQLPRFTQEEFLDLIAFANTCVNHTVLSPEDYYAVPLSKRRLEVRSSRIGDVREEETEEGDPTAEFLALFREAVKEGDREAVENRWMTLSPRLLRRLLANGGGREDTFLRAQHTFVRILTLLEMEARSAGAGDTAVRNLTWRFTRSAEESIVRKQLEVLYKQALLAYTEAVRSRCMENPDGNRMIARAMDAIDRHITEPVSGAEIARELGLSPSYFSAAFHRLSGMTVTSYIQKEKVRVAAELLRDTEEPLGEISAYLGFSSQSHFQNIFKKVMGVTPLSYRNHPVVTVSKKK